MSNRKRAEIKERTTVTRPGVLKRDGYRCRACGYGRAWNAPIWTDQPGRWLEVHEEPPRSLGGNPNRPADCITLCARYTGDGCHQRRTAGKLLILKGPDGCDAPVSFTEGNRTWTG
jgi:hypothetical protein